jgi:hypothetical protein
VGMWYNGAWIGEHLSYGTTKGYPTWLGNEPQERR